MGTSAAHKAVAGCTCGSARPAAWASVKKTTIYHPAYQVNPWLKAKLRYN